jgi:hypothetical protein
MQSPYQVYFRIGTNGVKKPKTEPVDVFQGESGKHFYLENIGEK